eukprot:scaffold32237_cov22-Tisochrysis_lutea.AAC.2
MMTGTDTPTSFNSGTTSSTCSNKQARHHIMCNSTFSSGQLKNSRLSRQSSYLKCDSAGEGGLVGAA